MGRTDKAERLARSGAVQISDLTADELRAVVQGDTGVWTVRRDPSGWRCTCPANELGRHRCSHIEATYLEERWGSIYAAERRAAARMARRERRP